MEGLDVALVVGLNDAVVGDLVVVEAEKGDNLARLVQDADDAEALVVAKVVIPAGLKAVVAAVGRTTVGASSRGAVLRVDYVRAVGGVLAVVDLEGPCALGAVLLAVAVEAVESPRLIALENSSSGNRGGHDGSSEGLGKEHDEEGWCGGLWLCCKCEEGGKENEGGGSDMVKMRWNILGICLGCCCSFILEFHRN